MLFLRVMRRKEMHKLITCIASEDKMQEALLGLEKDYGTQAMVDYFARGFGRSSTSVIEGAGQQTEKTIMTVLVKAELADEIFSYLYFSADLDRPHGGIIYVTSITNAIASPSIDATHLEQPLED